MCFSVAVVDMTMMRHDHVGKISHSSPPNEWNFIVIGSFIIILRIFEPFLPLIHPLLRTGKRLGYALACGLIVVVRQISSKRYF